MVYNQSEAVCLSDCVCVCVCVNLGGTDYNRYTRYMGIQTPTWTIPPRHFPHEKSSPPQKILPNNPWTFPPEIPFTEFPRTFSALGHSSKMPAECHSPWAARLLSIPLLRHCQCHCWSCRWHLFKAFACHFKAVSRCALLPNVFGLLLLDKVGCYYVF